MGLISKCVELIKQKFNIFLDLLAEKDEKSGFLLPDFLNKRVQLKEVTIKVLNIKENWFGITYPKDIMDARENVNTLMKAGRYINI